MKMNEICFYINSVSHQCICDKTTTTLCVQAVGTCQALGAKTCLSGYVRHILWGVEMFFGAFDNKCNHMYYFF